MNTEDIQTSLGRAIRSKRHALGVSQEALADMVGIHRTYIGSVERGERNISLQNLFRIASVLGITVSKLLAIAERDAIG